MTWVEQVLKFSWWRTLLALGGVLLAGGVWLSGASAAVDEQGGFIAFTEENDSFSDPFGPHQDRHYTQGLKISLFGGDDFAPGMTNALNRIVPAWGFNPQAVDLGWILLGQNIYTPGRILTNALIKTDRPYAGWLYTGAMYQRRGEMAPNLAVMENFEVNLGIVGPDSLAGESQRQVHRWLFPLDIPQGWGNQLRDEPGLVLKYGRSWRWSPTTETARYVDVIPHVGGDLGNVFTFATGGATLRVGRNLPQDFGVAIIDSPTSVNGGLTRQTRSSFAYLFGSLDGRVVGHDITLDGNTFRGGPSVEKEILVADISWGFAVEVFKHMEFTYERIIRTQEFRGQQGKDILGSLTLKGKFDF
jgi:hypothetical protein